MNFFVCLGSLDQGANRCRCGVENRYLVTLDHLPEAARIRKGRNAFKNNLCGTSSERAVSHVGMACDPADIGRAPEDVRRSQVKRPVHRELGPQQIAPGAVLHALGFAGRAGRVQNEQRVFGTDKLGLARRIGTGHHIGHEAVPAVHHVALCGGALVHNHVFNRLATAERQALINDGFQRQLLATAQLIVGSDHGNGSRVLNAFLQAFG